MNQSHNNDSNSHNNTKTPNQGLNFQNQPTLLIQLQFTKQNKTPSQFPIFCCPSCCDPSRMLLSNLIMKPFNLQQNSQINY
jgi:hypothetical protein